MLGTIIVVLLAVAVLVPIALFAAFNATKDSHRYECHYDENGFSPEVIVETQVSNAPETPVAEAPLEEWPSEL